MEMEQTQEKEQKESWWVETYRRHELIGCLWLGAAAMLFLSLGSHQPADHSANLIGPTGSYIARGLYFAFGMAAWLLPISLVCWGLQIIATKRRLTYRNGIALIIMAAAGACMVACQTFVFQNGITRFGLPQSLGGFISFWVSERGIERLFGPGGSFILMAGVALVTATIVTGIHPFRICGRIYQGCKSLLNRTNWEKKWRLWSGTPEPTVEPIDMSELMADSSTPPQAADPQVMAALAAEPAVDIKSTPARQTTPAAPVPAPVKPAAPDPQKVRQIVDATQKHHQAANAKNDDAGAIYVPKPGLETYQYEGYQPPSIELLAAPDLVEHDGSDDVMLRKIQDHIVETLKCFNVEVEPGGITQGPTITRYEFYPSMGLRVNKITALKDDLARATRAERINILAPIPGKATVGIEIANNDKQKVVLRELFESDAFRQSTAQLPLALGKDVYGNTIVGDLANMPHLLVAGATGSGKSVCINSIIASLLFRFSPDELKFVMIDPKVVEMQVYNSLPHMAFPVVTEPKKVLMALRWVIKEMEDRYVMFAKKGVRNFEGYNDLRGREVRAEEQLTQPNLVNTETGTDFLDDDERAAALAATSAESGAMPERLPYIVVIIDELADLMQTAPADVETGIARLAQKARAAGIHLIVATQTPRADVITGVIKANIPSRIAFQVSSKTDSRIILDENGAENLIGKGDMLYLPPGSAQHIRAQGALITDEEAQALVQACAQQGAPAFDTNFTDPYMEEEETQVQISDADEEMLGKCMEVIFTEKKASTSLLQRKLRLGYTRAARMIDVLETRGIIGPGDGAKPREILIDLSGVE